MAIRFMFYVCNNINKIQSEKLGIKNLKSRKVYLCRWSHVL